MTTEFSVKRITDALAAVDKARQKVDSAKATYKASRELLAEAQAALEDAIRAETSPVPLFDRSPPSEVSFTVEVGKALREGLAGTGVVLHENVSLSPGDGEPDQADDYEPPEPAEEVFPEPVAWNVYDAYRRKDTGQVEARSYSEAERIARGHYPEIPEGARLVTRVKWPGWGQPAAWVELVESIKKHCQVEWNPGLLEPARVVVDGQAYALDVPPNPEYLGLPGEVLGPLARAFTLPVIPPDAWRHQGVGLALRTLPLATVEKLGKAGLATVGALADHAGQAPGEMPAIKGLGAKATADVYAALDNHLEALREVHPDGDEDAE